MSLFNEDNIFSKYANLTHGPLKSKKYKFNIIINIYTIPLGWPSNLL